jgi:hypothetical protein
MRQHGLSANREAARALVALFANRLLAEHLVAVSPADDGERIRREQWAPAWGASADGPTHGG